MPEMQTKRLRLRAALFVSVLLGSVFFGAITLPGQSATAAVGSSPTLEVAPATCDLLGATDILVQAGGLLPGQLYTVTVSVASTRTTVDAKQVSGDSPSASLIFENLLNGDSYAVTIANAANTLSASTTVTMPVCDLPTLPDQQGGDAPPPTDGRPPAPDDLVNTGTVPTLLPAIGGLGLIQLGLALIGLAVYWAARLVSNGG